MSGKEWASKESLNEHLKKHVLESEKKEKDKWKIIYKENFVENLYLVDKQKQIKIYENESKSVYGDIENKRAKKIFLYEDYDKGSKSINLSRDDGLVVGENKNQIRTCFFKTNKILLDTEIISLITRLIKLKEDEIKEDVIKLYGQDIYFYHSKNLYEKYNSVIQNNKIDFSKLSLKTSDSKNMDELLDEKRKKIVCGVFAHFLRNQYDHRNNETKEIYSVIIDYLNNCDKLEKKIKDSLETQELYNKLEEKIKKNLNFALENLYIELNNKDEHVDLIDNYIIFNMIVISIINKSLNKKIDISNYIKEKVKFDSKFYDLDNMIYRYREICEILNLKN